MQPRPWLSLVLEVWKIPSDKNHKMELLRLKKVCILNLLNEAYLGVTVRQRKMISAKHLDAIRNNIRKGYSTLNHLISNKHRYLQLRP
jgi:hypothetical protein